MSVASSLPWVYPQQAASTTPDHTVTSQALPSSVHLPHTRLLSLKSSFPPRPHHHTYAALYILCPYCHLPTALPKFKAQHTYAQLTPVTSSKQGLKHLPSPGTAGQQGIGRALWAPWPCLPSEWQQQVLQQHHRHTQPCGGAHWVRRSVRPPALHQEPAEPIIISSSSRSRRVEASWGQQQVSRSLRSPAASSSGPSPTWPWPRSS